MALTDISVVNKLFTSPNPQHHGWIQSEYTVKVPFRFYSFISFQIYFAKIVSLRNTKDTSTLICRLTLTSLWRVICGH